MATSVNVNVDVNKKEFEKFKNEYEKFKNESERGVDLKVNEKGLKNASNSLISVLSTMNSLTRITSRIVPLEDLLGLSQSQVNDILNSFTAITSSLQAIAFASNAVQASFGWITLAITGLSSLYSILKSANSEIDKFKSTPKETSELNKLFDERKRILAEIQTQMNSINKLSSQLNAEQKRQQVEELVKLRKELDYNNRKIEEYKNKEKTTGEKESARKEEKLKSELETQLDKYLETFKKVVDISKIDSENKEEWDKDIREKIAEFVSYIGGTGKSLDDLSLNEITTLKNIMHTLGVETIDDLIKKMNGLATATEEAQANLRAKNDKREAENQAREEAKKIANLIKIAGNATLEIIKSIDSFLQDDVETGVRQVLDSTVALTSSLFKQFGGAWGQAIAAGIDMVWGIISSIWSIFSADAKRKREAYLKQLEEARRREFERESDLRKKEIKSKEEYVKNLEKARKEMDKNLSIYEDAFKRGVIGIEAYTKQLEKAREVEKQEDEAKSELDRLKKRDEDEKKLNEIREKLIKKYSDLAEVQDFSIEGIRKEIDYQNKKGDKADKSYYNRAWWDWSGSANDAGTAREAWRKAGSLEQALKELTDEIKSKGIGEPMGAPALPEMMRSDAYMPQSESNITINVNGTFDLTNPQSIKNFTDILIRELRVRKLEGNLNV